MAVYKHTYRRYHGGLTPAWSRFLILPRYALRAMFESRLLSLFFLGCFLFPVLCAIVIYVNSNLSTLALFNFKATKALDIDNDFFLMFLTVQTVLGFLLAAIVGPGLVSPDLVNQALPLYLCRPFSRAEYVAGKLSALALLLSVVTWIPALLLFLLQASLAGAQWWQANAWVAGAILLSSWLWILVLSLLILALSAWVKWKLAASGLLLGVFFVAAGFGSAINEALDTRWGHLVNFGQLLGTVWGELFRVRQRNTFWSALFRTPKHEELPVWAASVALVALAALCLYLLARKIKACEVVRS